jgi:hypothetical protein
VRSGEGPFRFGWRTCAQAGARMTSNYSTSAARPLMLFGGSAMGTGVAAGFDGRNECMAGDGTAVTTAAKTPHRPRTNSLPFANDAVRKDAGFSFMHRRPSLRRQSPPQPLLWCLATIMMTLAQMTQAGDEAERACKRVERQLQREGFM